MTTTQIKIVCGEHHWYIDEQELVDHSEKLRDIITTAKVDGKVKLTARGRVSRNKYLLWPAPTRLFSRTQRT